MRSCDECGISESKGFVTHRPTCSKVWVSQVVHDILAHDAATAGMATDAYVGLLRAANIEADAAGPPYAHTLGDAPAIPDISHASRGRKGGATRAARMTPEQRSEAARAAARVRWKKPG